MKTVAIVAVQALFLFQYVFLPACVVAVEGTPAGAPASTAPEPATATPPPGASPVSATPAQAPAAGSPASAPVADSRAGRPITDKWALVIGVSRFQDPSIRLRYAAKDAMDFYDFLVNQAHFAPDHVKLLVDEDATRERVLDELGDKWLPRVALPDDLVLIYVSSHGSPSGSDVGGVNYIVAHNTDKNRLYSTGIPIQDLTRLIKDRVHSDRVVVVLDACHSGAAQTDNKGLFRERNVNIDDIVQGTGQMVICSSEPSQSSWESKTYPNGVFTKQLIEGLKQKGDKTPLGDAFDYVRDKVAQEVLGARGELQRPVLKSAWAGNDLVLAAVPTNPRAALIEDPAASETAIAGARSERQSEAVDSRAAEAARTALASATPQGATVSPAAALIPNTVWDSYMESARKAYAQGAYSEAEAIFNSALKEALKFGDFDPRLALTFDGIGVSCFYQGKNAEAERALKQAIAIDERNSKNDPKQLALHLEHLARVFYTQGKYAEAEPLLQRALAIWEQSLGTDQPKNALCVDLLGSVYREQGKYALAVPLLERAQVIAENSLGADDSQTAKIWYDLALTDYKNAQYAPAEALYKKALAVWEKDKDPNSKALVMRTLVDIGNVYLAQNKLPKAESSLNRVVYMSKKSTFSPPSDLADALQKSAEAYRAQAKEARAVEISNLAHGIKEQSASARPHDPMVSLNKMELVVPPQPLDFGPWSVKATYAKSGQVYTGKWVWNHAKQQFTGLWDYGASSKAKLDRFDDNEVSINDAVSNGMKVHFAGVRTGKSVRGSFKASNPSATGTWEASW